MYNPRIYDHCEGFYDDKLWIKSPSLVRVIAKHGGMPRNTYKSEMFGVGKEKVIKTNEGNKGSLH